MYGDHDADKKMYLPKQLIMHIVVAFSNAPFFCLDVTRNVFLYVCVPIIDMLIYDIVLKSSDQEKS